MPTEVAPDLDLAEIIEDDDLPSPAPKAPTPKAAVSPPTPPPPPPPPPPAAKKHTHSPLLLREAAKFGYTADVLADYPSEAVWEELHRLKELNAGPKPAAPVAANVAPTPPPADPDDETLSEWEQVDPKGAAYLRRQREKMAKLEASLKEKDEKLDAITKSEQQRQQRAWQEHVHRSFEPHKKALGEGAVAQARMTAVIGYLNQFQNDPEKTKRPLTDLIGEAVVALGFAAAPAGHVAPPPPAEPTPARRLPPKNPENGRFTKEDFAAGLVHRPDGGDAGNTDDLTDAELVRRRRREHGDPRGDRRSFASDDDSDMPFTEER